MKDQALRMLIVILAATAILVGAALVRGVSYALTHAVGFSFGSAADPPQPRRGPVGSGTT